MLITNHNYLFKIYIIDISCTLILILFLMNLKIILKNNQI